MIGNLTAWTSRFVPSEKARRVLINPARLITRKSSPALLAAHLSNFALCDSPGFPCHGHAEAKVVFVAANQVFFRHGLEAHVRAHSLSFCADTVCNDIGFGEGHLPWQRQLERRNWTQRVGGRPGSPLVERQWHLVRTLNDSLTRENLWVNAYVQLLSKNVAGWAPAPVNAHVHEGAFYPAWLLRRFSRRLHGTVFGRALEAQQNRSWCECCELFEPVIFLKTPRPVAGREAHRLARDSAAKGACGFEETLLPTYVWQRHQDLISTAAPPLALRVWNPPVAGGSSEVLHSLSRALVRAPASDGLSHLFALKVPLSTFDTLAHYIWPNHSIYAVPPSAARPAHRPRAARLTPKRAVPPAPSSSRASHEVPAPPGKAAALSAGRPPQRAQGPGSPRRAI